jgi:chromosome segregation ATPase
VYDLSLWKYSFELVTRELEVTRKKKQALDNLYAADKISQSTYEYLETELSKAVAELEDHLKTLMDKMTSRAQELEKQISTLELFLASLELHHAAGDVNDETYDKQNKAILLGLEATRQELNDIESSSHKTASPPVELPVVTTTPVLQKPQAIAVDEELESEVPEEPPEDEPTDYSVAEAAETNPEDYSEISPADPEEKEPSSIAVYNDEPSETSTFESDTTIDC